jgi:hypothetical protein
MTESTFKKPERVSVDALGYLSEVLKNGLAKDLQDNQILCPECRGTGLAITNHIYGLKDDPDKSKHFPYSNQYIVGCQHCYTGVINLCEHCHSELPRSKCRCDCDKAEAVRYSDKLAKETAAWDKAIKLKSDDEIAKGMGMYCSDDYPYNDGYFSEIENFIEWWEDNHDPEEEKPLYVWGTTSISLSLDADSILGSASDDLHEEAGSNIEGKAELQQFLDSWCAKQRGTTTYYSDTKYAIEIPW